ncbi:MAG: dUTPase [Firmicutes bacterium]|nr:dUTPase [Bacillota bacterium]
MDNSKDKLDVIFSLQQQLNGHIAKTRGLDFSDKSLWLQRETLAMLSEMAELLNEVNFKWWKNHKPVDDNAVKEEIVDIFHFFVSMCLIAGMDASELYEIYLQKNEENFKRQFGTSLKEGYSLENR